MSESLSIEQNEQIGTGIYQITEGVGAPEVAILAPEDSEQEVITDVVESDTI